MKRIGLVLAVLLVVGCSQNSGVVKMGPDSYMVTRQAATGFSGQGTLTADAIRQANEYCAQQGKTANVTHTQEAQPPYIFGNFPRSEVDFTCAGTTKRP